MVLRLNNIETHISAINSTRTALTVHAEDINNIKQFQRVCFWGLGL